MKTQLTIIILCITSVAGFSQQFNASVMDLETGKLKIYAGTINIQESEVDASIRRTGESIARIREITRRSMERLEAESARASAEYAATKLQEQLEEQNRLLRKIAEQK